MGQPLLSLLFGLSLAGVSHIDRTGTVDPADETPVGITRFLEMNELARCMKRGTNENPVLVYAPHGIAHRLRLAIAIFTNDMDVDHSKAGMFEFAGIALTGESVYWGAMTNVCSQDLNAESKVIDCSHDRGIGQLLKETSTGKTKYIATQFVESAQNARKTEFAEEDCSFWPHGQPSQKDRVVLQSIPFNRYCADSGPIIFKIEQNYNPVNPLKVEFGNAYSNCIHAILSSPTNYEFWMNARNQFMDHETVDPQIFKDKQLFDIDADGDLDLIQVEKDLNNEQFPNGAWNLVLYKK